MQNISFKLGYKYLRSNKGGLFSFTSLLAVIGMMIGLASLIVVTSVMNGFEKELENRILGVIPHATISSNKPIDNFEDIVADINLDNEIDIATFPVLSTADSVLLIKCKKNLIIN